MEAEKRKPSAQAPQANPKTYPCPDCGKDISKLAHACPHCGRPLITQENPVEPTQEKKGKKLGCLSICLIIISILYTVGKFTGTNNSSSQSTSAHTIGSTTNDITENRYILKQNTIMNVDIKFSWSKNGFGNIMIADFVITNNSDYIVKDIEITCYSYANSGTMIDKNTRIIYELLQPKKKKSLKQFNMGFVHTQAAKVNCECTDLVLY